MKLSVLSLCVFASFSAAAPAAVPIKNVIMMVSDGFGPASETFARAYVEQNDKLPVNYMSALDQLFVGSSRTRSADSFVTDSAPGAVCFASALKTYNNAIGVDVNVEPIGTNMEAAHRNGMKTGLVVKSFITDATPAAFAAHAATRYMQDLIAEQLGGLTDLGQNVDLMFGGGRCEFIGNATKGSCRTDNKDVWGQMQKNGWGLISTNDEFKSLTSTSKMPLMGLFDLEKVPYAIDYSRNDVPNLTQMAQKALDILTESTKNSDKGFYIMIEGSRIDHGGHDNDLGTHVREIIEYWDTVKMVSEYLDSHPDTVMVSTSDHECGGLTIGRDNNYWYYPLTYLNQTMSQEQSCNGLLALPVAKRGAYVTEQMLPIHLGIANATAAKASAILKATDYSSCLVAMRDALAVDANIQWTSLGHTGVDVNIYAKGPRTDELRGNHENTDIGHWLNSVLGVDIAQATEIIKNTNVFQYPFTKANSTLIYSGPLDYHR
ncbi:hypothetical protein BB559_000610 [Furculomyces boomerangus]|uniref:alkaline phosphatase n=2 Tax=Harpellales TaxID=61421 RepID=A0A2T9Z4Q5_9FUNG|nr:hypothetical protein BB559_000610 [Furculomyces boomerangus]PVZ99394.1 hypothetical protein BB558_004589 [Smittium angustum]PVZ99578.1 hypothetical protein BB558_004394 [Smittium angustum]